MNKNKTSINRHADKSKSDKKQLSKNLAKRSHEHILNNKSANNLKSKNLKSDHLKLYFFLAAIIILTVILYAKLIHNGFIEGWDDDQYVSKNHDIMSLSLQSLKNICTKFYVSCYLPVTMLTFALEFKLFGMHASAYHFDNLLLHLLNTILVYVFVKSLFSNNFAGFQNLRGLHQARNTQYTALICSLLFAIHPMHVESVAWLSERKDLMYTFFFLASLIYYIKYIQQSTFSLQHSKFYNLSLLMFILSLLSKSMAVTLPVVLILLDYFKGRFDINSNFKIQNLKLPEKLPFFALSLIFGILTFVSQKALNATNYNEHVLNKNFLDTFFMLCYSVSYYIVMLFAPFNLSVIHPFPVKTGGFLPLQYYLSPLLILGLLFLIFWSIKRNANKEILNANPELQTSNSLPPTLNLLIFGILFFIITISVVIYVPVGYALVAERYTYVPYLGFFIIIGSFFTNSNFKISPFALRSLLIGCLLYFSFITYSRTLVWKDGIILFTDVIDKYPDVSIAYNTRGCAKNNLNEYKAAIEDFDKSIALKPDYAMAYNNRGWAEVNIEDLKDALNDFNKAISINPEYETAYSNRGGLKGKINDYKGAIKDLDKAISISPDDGVAYSNRGWSESMLTDYTNAIADLNKAISLSPDLAMPYFNRGMAKTNTGDVKGALEDYDKAIKLNPYLETAYTNRGSLKGNMNDFQGALQDFDIAISINPRNTLAFYYRGLTKSNLQDYNGALDDLNRAIALNQKDARAYFVRGNVYFNLKENTYACQDWNSALQLGWTGAQNKLSANCR